MLPVLYSSSSSEFASNGLGVLVDCLKCEVTEERNGIFEMVFTYPASGQHADLIVPDAIVKATAHYGDEGQLFRIYEVTKTLDGNYEVYCQHISYQLSYIPCLPFNATDAPTAMSMIQSHMITDDAFAQRFTFSTDKTTVANMSVEVPITTRSLLGGVEGSVLDVYGGEYEFDNFNVKLLAHRGQDRGVVLRYGKNISDISQEVNIENVYTHLLPFYNKDGVYVEVPDTYIACETASQFPFKRIMILDCTSEFDLVDEETGEERAPTPQELLEYAQMYMSNRDFGKIDVSIDVDFENISDIIEYSDYANLEMVRLCDTVSVYFPPLDITATTNVIKTVWNALLDRYKELSLGKPKSNFTSVVASVTEKTTEKVDDLEKKTHETIDRVTRTFLGLNGGYKVEKTNGNGQIIETLYMDTLDESTATKVWRWNINGLAYSPNGINGPYTTAITKDGEIVSDFVSTGVLRSRDSLTDPKFYLNLDTGVLRGNFSELKIGTLNAATQNDVNNAKQSAVDTAALALANFISGQYTTDMDYIQQQLDGQIEQWFESYIPTLSNYPANGWVEEGKEADHLGDLFYVVDDPDHGGECYRFVVLNNVYQWSLVEDAGVATAIQTANEAKAIAGTKRRVFVAEPTTPYEIGDLWVQGSSGGIMRCATARATGNYQPSDWVSASNYIDSTQATTIANSSAANAVSAYDNNLDQLAVFNKLTNNQADQGIYLENGQLYINASMIAAGTIRGVYIELENEDNAESLARTKVRGKHIFWPGTEYEFTEYYETMLSPTGVVAGHGSGYDNLTAKSFLSGSGLGFTVNGTDVASYGNGIITLKNGSIRSIGYSGSIDSSGASSAGSIFLGQYAVAGSYYNPSIAFHIGGRATNIWCYVTFSSGSSYSDASISTFYAVGTGPDTPIYATRGTGSVNGVDCVQFSFYMDVNSTYYQAQVDDVIIPAYGGRTYNGGVDNSFFGGGVYLSNSYVSQAHKKASKVYGSSNASSGYYRLPWSGTQIAWKQVQWTGAINQAWGSSVYESASVIALGDWAKAFSATPSVTYSAHTSGTNTAWVSAGNIPPSATNAGSVFLERGGSTLASTTWTIRAMAIGPYSP